MDDGSRPSEWPGIRLAWESTAGRFVGGTAQNAAEDKRKLKTDRRENGVSVCMALKLINRDETASVIKTGHTSEHVPPPPPYFI